MLTQRPSVRRLLPLQIEETDEPAPSGLLPQYELEPSPEVVLDALLPQYVAAGSTTRCSRRPRPSWPRAGGR